MNSLDNFCSRKHLQNEITRNEIYANKRQFILEYNRPIWLTMEKARTILERQYLQGRNSEE
jgi:hypothetical protein